MKILSFIILLGYASSSEFLEPLGYGESCDAFPSMTILNFEMTPFPIVIAQQYSLIIDAQFNSKEFVDQIYIGQRTSLGLWHYTYQSINQEFAKGASNRFTISLEAPAVKGSYDEQITFHRSDFSYIACWKFSFKL